MRVAKMFIIAIINLVKTVITLALVCLGLLITAWLFIKLGIKVQ